MRPFRRVSLRSYTRVDVQTPSYSLEDALAADKTARQGTGAQEAGSKLNITKVKNESLV